MSELRWQANPKRCLYTSSLQASVRLLAVKLSNRFQSGLNVTESFLCTCSVWNTANFLLLWLTYHLCHFWVCMMSCISPRHTKAKLLCLPAKAARKITKACKLSHFFTDTAGRTAQCRAPHSRSFTASGAEEMLLTVCFPTPPFSDAT